MLKLALLGGQPHIKEKMEWGSFWPPIDDTTGEKLKELYLSRDWSFNSKIEQNLPSRLLNIMVPSMAYLWQMGL